MAFEFLADSAIYSVAKSKGTGSFKFRIAKGKDAVNILLFGLISGLAIDYLVRKIEESQKTVAEKELEALAEEEREKMLAETDGKTPVGVIWNGGNMV